MTRVAGPAPFFYIAVRAGGGRKFGLRQARSVAALADSLRRESLLLLRWWQLPAWAGRETTLRLKDHAALNEQLAQLLSRGVPLVEALEVTASAVQPGARARVERMRELVASGSSFADACRAVGGFDQVTIAVYRAAERTGDLAGAARRLAEAARRQMAISGKAVTLMIYPAIVLTISLLIAFGMMLGVVPMLHERLRDMQVRLPLFSRLVMGAGTWMRDHLMLVALAAGAAAVALLLSRRTVGAFLAGLARRMPLLREVVLAQESARFFSVMAAMVRSGVQIADALAVANQAVGHPRLRAQLERLRTRLVGGGLLRNLLEEVEALPLPTRRLLVASERSGDLENAFTTLAADMADEVDRRSTRLLALLEPALIVLMFLIIGSLLVSILLPLLTMDIRGGR
jgi:type II secretory pathway component PulF